jgi:hypothetical protein
MRRLGNALAVALVAATVALAEGTASADTGPVRGAGYVWADNPAAAAYTPAPGYQMNTTGITTRNTITRISAGRYSVRFTGLGVLGGVAHATAYGAGTHTCKVEGWSPSGDDQNVVVRCFTLAGVPVDSRFTASFTSNKYWHGWEYGRTYPGAYLYHGDPTSPNTTPSTLYQYNSAGGVNTVSRVGVGTYSAFLPGIGHAVTGGHALVTAYGSAAERCKVVNFGWTSPSTTIKVNVRCFTAAGAPADSRFVLTFTDRTNTLGLDGCCNPNGHQSGYALANDPTAASYSPSASYQHEVPSGGATAARSATGNYTMRFTHADLTTGTVHVAATGWTAEFCKIAYWNPTSGINVRCYDTAGAPADTPYDLDYTGPWLLG